MEIDSSPYVMTVPLNTNTADRFIIYLMWFVHRYVVGEEQGCGYRSLFSRFGLFALYKKLADALTRRGR